MLIIAATVQPSRRDTMKKVKLSELTPDDINANKGTQRGSGMLEKSLREYGAGRSVLVDKAGRIIAGNKTIEAAGAIGLEDAVMIETDGSRVVIVKRTDLDLDSPQGRGLAIADNRVAEVGLEWDMEALEKIGEELDLGEFWFDDELPQLDFSDIEDFEEENHTQESDEPLTYRIMIDFVSEAEQVKATEDLEKKGYVCQLLIL